MPLAKFDRYFIGQKIASQMLQEFEAQGELIFIEGLTKDKKMLVRCECAKALAALGVQNFRVLLMGLRDENEKVRKTTS